MDFVFLILVMFIFKLDTNFPSLGPNSEYFFDFIRFFGSMRQKNMLISAIFWRKVLKEVVYNSHQFDIQLEMSVAQFLFWGSKLSKITRGKVETVRGVCENFNFSFF